MNWDRPKQRFVADGDIRGDCWRCCVAAVLQLPIEEVPHFLVEAMDKGRSMQPHCQAWLNDRDLCLVEAEMHSFNFPRYHGELPNLPLPVICCGPTERSRGMGKHHAVVFVGPNMVYDPHPSNAGLTAVTHQYLIVPIPEMLRIPEGWREPDATPE